MADAPILAMDVLEWSRHFRCFPGQGEFDLPGFLAPIIQSGYTGPLSLEIFNDGFRAAPPRANAADGLRSLLYLEEKTRQRLEQESRPAANLDILFETPKASEYNGIEFLEFAVDESLGAKLELAGAPGLRQGRPAPLQERQPVAPGRYQPDPQLRTLFVRPQFFEAHGPSLCATAVRVKDSASALARAVAYKASPIAGWSAPTNWNWPRCARRMAA
jgi:4-hydroxyphenylpyruvate dioxygenase